jgi:hypothetical protein
MTINRCTFIGRDFGGGSLSAYGIWWSGSTGDTLDITDCVFINCDVMVHGNALFGTDGTINEDYCGFYNFTTKNGGTSTFNVTNEISTSVDPLIREPTNGFLDISSSTYIGSSSTSDDVGAFPDAPLTGEYNTLKAFTDTITETDSTVDKRLETETDYLWMVEDTDTTNFNLSLEMVGGGLFRTASDGTLTYLHNAV